MAPDPTGIETLAERAREQRLIARHIGRGELSAALAALRQELDLRRHIARLAPGDAHKRADAERAAARVAEVLVFRSAIRSLGRGVNARCGLGAVAAKQAVRDHNAAWIQRSVGRTLQEKGNVAGALALYREGLDIRRKLAEREPGNLELLVDVTLSLAAIAEALAAGGDLAGALTSMNEALAIRRALAAREPENARRRLDVAWSLMGMANLLKAQDEAEPALAAVREALAIRRAASALDPTNDGLRRDVAVSLARLGDMQAARGDRGGACAVYEEARDIVRALAACAPDSGTERSDLAALDERIAAAATAE